MPCRKNNEGSVNLFSIESKAAMQPRINVITLGVRDFR